MEEAYNRTKGEEEHILCLPGGRRLAYANNGPSTSRTVVIFFSGMMSVGTAPVVPIPCRKLGMHWIAPTLPGMGRSSTRNMSVPYHVGLARDISALLEHFYPNGEFDRIYIAGGSFGTVQAQMLFGAPYDIFPAGHKIAGCILLAGFSPVKHDLQYTKQLSWQNWFSFGPPSQLPFRPLQRLFGSVVAAKFRRLEGAKDFIRQTIVSQMDEDERVKLAEWLHKNDRTEDEWMEATAKMAMRSCENWDGFMEISDVIRSDWGFAPATLDDEHASKPILVVGSQNDHIGGSNNGWLVENYKSAKLKVIPGGHISSIYYMDEIWQEMIDLKA
jgi:pimeloyl-ACP methyl ester carboxylesterase